MITLDSVSKSYAKGQPAVNNVSLHIEKGEFVFIVGNSGSGKSTLIKLLLKELEPTSGTIKVNGQILNKMKRWRVPKLSLIHIWITQTSSIRSRPTASSSSPTRRFPGPWTANTAEITAMSASKRANMPWNWF